MSSAEPAAHPARRPASPHAFDGDEARTVLEAGRDAGLGLRVHGNQLSAGPGVRLAVELGCRVSIDTDAHAPGQLEWLGFGCEQAVQAGVDLATIVNSWPVGRLLQWTASHDATRGPLVAEHPDR